MTIRFDLELHDLVAFASYYESHTPSIRWLRLVIMLVILAPLLFLPMLLVAPEYRVLALSAGTAVAIGVAWQLPQALARATEKRYWRLYKGSLNTGMFGPHELELTETHIIRRNPSGESTTRLAALGPMAVSSDYTFIYVSPTTAYVIPRKAVTSGDYGQFVAAVSEALARAKGISP